MLHFAPLARRQVENVQVVEKVVRIVSAKHNDEILSQQVGGMRISLFKVTLAFKLRPFPGIYVQSPGIAQRQIISVACTETREMRERSNAQRRHDTTLPRSHANPWRFRSRRHSKARREKKEEEKFKMEASRVKRNAPSSFQTRSYVF